MSLVAIVRALVEAGASPSMILAAVEAGEAAREEQNEAKRELNRERVRRHREMKRDVTLHSVTDITVPSPPLSPLSPFPDPIPNPPYNPPTPSISVQRKRSTPSEFFDRFWNAYPKREGSNPKQPALKAFNRAIDAGGEPETIIRGAQHYRAQQVGKDARFVAQAVTWLNQERWNDHIPTAPVLVSTGPPPDVVTDEDVQRMARELGLVK